VRCKSLHIWQILNTKRPYEMFHLKKIDSFPMTINYPNTPINQIIPTKLKSTFYLWLETARLCIKYTCGIFSFIDFTSMAQTP
jgi:hypothetical protein